MATLGVALTAVMCLCTTTPALAGGGGGPIGACCLPSGGCLPNQVAAICTAIGGLYQGDGTACGPEACDACPGDGSCFFSNGTPGCDDAACCAAVCAADPFCCDVVWDETCAGGALELCGNPACLDGGSSGTSNCFVANETPGCDDSACCAAVCAADPFCCDVEWDEICAASALELCGQVLGCPGEGDCYSPNGTPGCEDSVCCTTVCLIDPFCCDVEWDDMCAKTAAAECRGACCLLDGSCVEGLSGPECETADGSYQGAGTACGEPVGPVGLFSEVFLDIPDADATGISDTLVVEGTNDLVVLDVDVQLTIEHTWVGDLCVSLEHNGTTVQLIQRSGLDGPCDATGCCGCSENNYAGIVLDDDGEGGSIEDACAVDLTSPPGYTPVAPLSAFNGLEAAGEWTLTVNDNAAADTGVLISWSLNILLGQSICDTCPGEGDCFAPNGTPGCQDKDCCEVVCEFDPFCCDVEWDELCVSEAIGLCLGCGANDSGDCGEANGSPACTNALCCALVCTLDPFCCDVEWDGICADEAADFCCPGDVIPDGFVNVDDLVTVILSWGPCPGFPFVCAADLDGNRVVDVDDLVTVILNWGPCFPVSP